MVSKLIGIKRLKGENKTTHKPYDFTVACFTSDFTEGDIENHDAKGQQVHAPSVPDSFKEVITEKNIGKEFEVSYFFQNGREQIGFCQLLK